MIANGWVVLVNLIFIDRILTGSKINKHYSAYLFYSLYNDTQWWNGNSFENDPCIPYL
jgi:hypothetical protein